MAFPAAPKPPTHLGYYRLLAPSAGVRVSPLCLGGMSFGEDWKDRLGECDKPTSFEIMDTFFEAGGNFIDTANNYQGEQSEEWIGEWMKSRGNRDEIVLATKYTTGYPRPGRSDIKLRINYQGNHAKSLRVSVEASLKKLQTDYIDLLWVHWWDFSTNIREVMASLHHLVASGKVLYLGISDTPAWIVSKANQYARDHGLTPFCVYQGLWNASIRDFERDILPMCEDEGMGLAPWGVLGQGQFRKPDDKGNMVRKATLKPGDRDAHIVEALDKIATQHNTRITSIAMAYVRQKSPYVYPIVGCRTKDHLLSNIEALKIQLTDAEIAAIEDAAPFDHGFPHSFLLNASPGHAFTSLNTSDIWLVKAAGHIDIPAKVRAPAPRED